MVGAEVQGTGRLPVCASKRMLGKKQPSKLGKLDREVRLHRPPREPQLQCPECGSSKLFKDGFRYRYGGAAVQRWLCRNCGYRFSLEKGRGQCGKPLQKTSKQSLNNGSGLYSNRQVCVALTRGAKNLAAADKQ